MTTPLLHWCEDYSRSLMPTTLSHLGKSEAFLETILFDHFDLLGLDEGQLGIRGPYRCWRQVRLRTPDDRTIFPDIVAISASGHLIIVEVKLGSNDDLKSRKVLSQIVDYAASFSAASRSDLIEMFQSDGSPETTWEALVGSLFPETQQVQQTASLLEQRIRDGELNLIIACDHSPLGTRELLRGVAVQSSLGFQLDLIEITPHIDEQSDQDDIVFVPRRTATTEIISRTAVTVSIEEGASRPGVVVESTPLAELEDRLAEGRQRRDAGRKWTPAEIESAYDRDGTTIEKRLLNFCKQHGLEGKFSSAGLKKRAAFGFYVPILTETGARHSRMAFTTGYDSGIWLYLDRFKRETSLGESLSAEYLQKLEQAFQGEIDCSTKKELPVAWALIEKHFDAFCDALIWLKSNLEGRCERAMEEADSV